MRSVYIGNNNCSRCGGGDPNCYVCHELSIDSAKYINTPQKKTLQVASNTLMSSHDATQNAERPSTTNKETQNDG